MSAILRQIPVPIFGSALAAAQFGARKSTSLPRYAPLAIPFGMGALWFVWPAVDEEWKGEMGLKAPELKQTVKIQGKVYKLNAAELKVLNGMEKGDYTELYKEWEAFNIKAMNPAEDDDEEDDDDDDDDDEEEEDAEESEDSSELTASGDDDEDEDGDEEEETTITRMLKLQQQEMEESRVMENIRKGDFSSLEADWDAFQIKASNPSEDDDDDEEDDDDDDDDDNEEEEEEDEDEAA